jgi:hypothetical protein
LAVPVIPTTEQVVFNSKRTRSNSSKPFSSKLNSVARAFAPFESLEDRKLFSVVTVTGTTGDDVIKVTQSSGQLHVDLNGSTTDYTASSVTQINVSAGDGNDQVLTDPSVAIKEVISGGNGNDTLNGGSAGDTIYGDSGYDTINGNGGNDTLYAGAPLSILNVSGISVKSLLQANKSIGPLKKTTVTGLRNPIGPISTILNKPLFGSLPGSTLSSSLYADSPKQLVTQTIPIVTVPIIPIIPLLNADVIHGNAGDDTIYGGPSSNYIYGDAGNDVIYGGGNVYNQLHGGDGNDTINGSTGSSTNVIFGDAGNDRLFARGYGKNTVNGGDGDDQLFAGPARSTLNGDNGDDVLVSIGGSHSDVVNGGGNLDEFWVDADSTEVIDANFIEALAGTVHRVSSFANGASINRNGQNITDPNTSRAYDDGSHYYPDSHNFSDHALFASTGPGEDDIRQGQCGDCYFLAGLSGTAKTDPLTIRKSVVDLGDGTYAVQFWKNGQRSFYRVDADLPVYQGTSSPYYAQLGAEGSMWVPIMEKAFTYFRSGANSYQSIWGGGDDEFRALNGQLETSVTGANASALLSNIQAQLNANKVVIAGTPNVDPTNGCPCVENHMYTVDHVNFQTMNVPLLGQITVPVSITLRNPWGYDGAGSDSNTSDGYVTATASQFYGYFNYVKAALM